MHRYLVVKQHFKASLCSTVQSLQCSIAVTVSLRLHMQVQPPLVCLCMHLVTQDLQLTL
jgi:hypothetical protein